MGGREIERDEGEGSGYKRSDAAHSVPLVTQLTLHKSTNHPPLPLSLTPSALLSLRLLRRCSQCLYPFRFLSLCNYRSVCGSVFPPASLSLRLNRLLSCALAPLTTAGLNGSRSSCTHWLPGGLPQRPLSL